MIEIPTPTDILADHYFIRKEVNDVTVTVFTYSISKETAETIYTATEFCESDETYRVLADGDDEDLDISSPTSVFSSVSGTSGKSDIFGYVFPNSNI